MLASTIDKYRKQFPQKIKDINVTNLRAFLDEHFLAPGSELTECLPIDWQSNPPKLMAIVDPILREWALELNGLWRHLCKQVLICIIYYYLKTFYVD